MKTCDWHEPNSLEGQFGSRKKAGEEFVNHESKKSFSTEDIVLNSRKK
jgi:hypothetical protein